MMTKTIKLVQKLYKDNETGKPITLTETQAKIFDLIWKKKHPRNHIMCHTRFGKSFVVALAVLTRITHFPEKWCIVAPSADKARIIMGYIIEHTFDNEYIKSKLEFDKGENLDRLRRERSKDRLNYKLADGNLGEVFIISADSRNKLKAGDAVMGFGAPNVIGDEMALIDDDIEAKIFRMLGDKTENFYFKIGNPFRRNHFLKDYQNPNFYKINADYLTGIKEGRLMPEFIEEAKKKPHFDILFGNKFPEADAIDDRGFSFLITDKEYEVALDTVDKNNWFGVKTLGVDVARGGGNYNVWVMRTANYAKILAKNQDNDLMSVVGTTIRLATENGIIMQNVFIDDTGVGGGVTDRLREQRFNVVPVGLGNKADEETKFVNRRAENYWKLKQWFNKGGKICASDNWEELKEMKYKTDSAGRTLIMSKDDMRKLGYPSPDVADSLMLTFDRNPVNIELQKKQQQQDNYDKYELI